MWAADVLYTVYCALHTVYCILGTVYCALYTVVLHPVNNIQYATWPPPRNLIEATSSWQRGLLEASSSETACATSPGLCNQAGPGHGS